MDLINPFDEVEVFGKAYPVAWPVQSATPVAAVTPRAKGHGLRLVRVKNSSGGGGKATRLEHYKIKPRGLRQGPFSKGSVSEGLRMAAGAKGVIPVGERNAIVPTGTGRLGGRQLIGRLRNKPVNSSIPTASKSGRRIG